MERDRSGQSPEITGTEKETVADAYDPLLYVGLDIGIKRDTTAIAAYYYDEREERYCLYAHRIFNPKKTGKPINMITEVEPALYYLLRSFRIAALLYDPYQAATTAQKFTEAGYGNVLVEVNQQTEMVEACNTLHSLLQSDQLRMYFDGDIKAHFAHAAAIKTERGWRIVKQRQSRPIDFVIASAMALLGATRQLGRRLHQSYTTSPNRMRSLLDFV